MIIDLQMGGRWDDGHGKWEKAKFDVNVESIEELVYYHNQGSELLGYNLTGQCEDYEDSRLSEEFLKAAAKYPMLSVKEDGLEPEEFALLYLQIAKLADSDLIFTHIKGTESPTIDIGGYGLFYG